jgi:hypothetical protein
MKTLAIGLAVWSVLVLAGRGVIGAMGYGRTSPPSLLAVESMGGGSQVHTGPPTPDPQAHAANPGPWVVRLEVGDAFDGSKYVMTHPTRRFPAATAKHIWVLAEVKGLPQGTNLVGTVKAVDVVTPQGHVVRGRDVLAMNNESEGPDADVYFDFATRPGEWPRGAYVFRLETRTAMLGRAEFTVK